MGRSVQLPQFADLGALPAADRGVRALGRRGMRITILDRPAADLGPVELAGMQAQGFRSGEAVGARRRASQAMPSWAAASVAVKECCQKEDSRWRMREGA